MPDGTRFDAIFDDVLGELVALYAQLSYTPEIESTTYFDGDDLDHSKFVVRYHSTDEPPEVKELWIDVPYVGFITLLREICQLTIDGQYGR